MGEGAINPATSDEENEKQDILLKFEALKSQLKELLDKNETLSEQEQLPISEFDLDSENTEKLYKKSAEEREKTQVDYKTKISKWDRMKDVIIEKCWDVMEFKGKCLKAIGNSFLVENFALPYTDPEAIAKLKHSVQIRELDFSISKDQSTKPWAHVTKRKDNFGRAVSKSQGKSLKVPKTFEDELDILAPPSHGPPGVFQEFRGCSQLQLNSFLAAAREFPSLMEATVQLRKNFNARFDEMFALKEKELQEMSEKHERLRTIQYERAASCKIPSEESTPQDPVWTQIEKSHLILEVAPHEIRSKPPEQKKTIYTRKQKTDESKLQLQYATDSFRENALVKMMDGVLEVRWEDLLKKDVPPLEEVLSKIPEELQEEREKAVEDWKRKVRELEEGRKRYKKQIDEEWLQIIENLQERVQDFDKKLLNLYLFRLEVEAAINLKNLIIARTQLYHQRFKSLLKKEENLRNDLLNAEAEFRALNDIVRSMEESVAKCLLKQENLLAKDKLLEKKFKLEFRQNTPKTQVEQLFKLFKKRPKLLETATAPTAVIVQLAQCVVHRNLNTFLPPECVEYLRILEQYDSYNFASHLVNESKWECFCELRRQKIKSELKIKAICVELAEAESSVNMFSQSIKPAKEKIGQIANQLERQSSERTHFQQNIQLQIVLKQAILEVPISGQISDFDNTILLTRNSIKQLNRVLHKAGAKKIAALERMIKFNGQIVNLQWEYDKLTNRIENLEKRLQYLEKFKVTKEIFENLQKFSGGMDPREKEGIDMDAKAMALRESLRKKMRLVIEETDRTERKINRIKDDNKRMEERMKDISKKITQLKQRRDFKFEETLNDVTRHRLLLISRRGTLLTEIQQLDSNVSTLQSKLELLRMKTYPTLKASPIT